MADRALRITGEHVAERAFASSTQILDLEATFVALSNVGDLGDEQVDSLLLPVSGDAAAARQDGDAV